MTRKIITTTLAIFLIAVSSLSANASQWNRGEYCQPGAGGLGYSERGENEWRGNRGEHRGEILNELLDLSEAQQEQIEAIRTEERAAHAVLREKVREHQDQIQKLTQTGSFDEGLVRTIAEEKAELQVEMAILKARMHSKINAIMTPEQQELFNKIRSVRHNKKEKSRRGPDKRATQL